jgi:hypothetical protein
MILMEIPVLAAPGSGRIELAVTRATTSGRANFHDLPSKRFPSIVDVARTQKTLTAGALATAAATAIVVTTPKNGSDFANKPI